MARKASPKGMPILLQHRLALIKIIITGEKAQGKEEFPTSLIRNFSMPDFGSSGQPRECAHSSKLIGLEFVGEERFTNTE